MLLNFLMCRTLLATEAAAVASPFRETVQKQWMCDHQCCHKKKLMMLSAWFNPTSRPECHCWKRNLPASAEMIGTIFCLRTQGGNQCPHWMHHHSWNTHNVHICWKKIFLLHTLHAGWRAESALQVQNSHFIFKFCRPACDTGIWTLFCSLMFKKANLC